MNITSEKPVTYTEKTINALRIIRHSHIRKLYSASGLAHLLWPEKLNSCGTSRRRVGYARTAGCYYSKLMRKGLVKHWITDYESGYYISPLGLEVLNKFDSNKQAVGT